ncbi:beta-mannosidase [Cavenderia fasciculata]|uniref:beta-mannosidase n=1 Tax=Cavenderia fasciculata TaxID=261658 RepID=F4QEC2_CACFS|nr:beta-mannosidase [Cavenderia fasciculata]EGG14069.1 beta-mannosidase [Cavenderia fasciculata]|eukprot:XP_004350777.1 beta-mannosidase [Cavenderia fasciculata]
MVNFNQNNHSILLDDDQWTINQLTRAGGGGEVDTQPKELITISNVTVPTDVHLTLMNKGIVPDLYFGEREMEYRWIALSNWQFVKTFEIVTEQHLKWFKDSIERIDLVCHGVDTISSIYLNDQLIGTTDNMFRTFRFNIKGHLQSGTNTIRFDFTNPSSYCEKKASENGYEIPLWEYPHGIHHRNFIRKCGCHFGWDWGGCYCPMGIYKSVLIEFFPKAVPKIESIMIKQQHHTKPSTAATTTTTVTTPRHSSQSSSTNLLLNLERYPTNKNVSLLFDFEIYSDQQQQENNDENENQLKIIISLIDSKEKNNSTSSSSSSSSSIATFNLPKLHQYKTLIKNIKVDIENGRLWWPNGHGEQALYKIEFHLNNMYVAERTVGLRTVSVDTTDGAFTIMVNGAKIFAKGADWIPADNFLNRITRDKYNHLLTSARDANMNCLRVWGGGIYESDDFYDICDRLGILIWQDFMFACCLYPSNKEFLDNVRKEVRDQVLRLDHHASLALWCGNNENEQALNVWKPSKDNPPRYIVDYNRLYIDTIMDELAQLSTSFFWPSSPSNGVNSWGDTNDQTRGDTHYWEVWHSNKPFTQYLKAKSRFLSEFGFQSLPRFQALKATLAGGDDQLNITSPEMEYRQRSPTPGNIGLLQHTALHFRVPTSFEHLCYTTQVLQAISIKTGCEHWRRMSPYCQGTLYWQLNDIWVGPSWSSIEYDRLKWKALQYFAKKFYAPTLLSIVENEQSKRMEVWVTNDAPKESFQAIIYLSVWDVVLGKVTKQIKQLVYCKAHSNHMIMDFDRQDFIPDSKKLNRQFIYIELEKEIENENQKERDSNQQDIDEKDNQIIQHGKQRISPLIDNTYFFKEYKEFNLQKPVITIKDLVKSDGCDDKYHLTLVSSEIALFVWIDRSGDQHVGGEFSDNAFHLFKDQPYTITYYSNYNNQSQQNQHHHQSTILTSNDFKIISLYDTYQNK